jgi:serine/threonine protein phosphatase PrpC
MTYVIAQDQNKKYRKNMEDFTSVKTNVNIHNDVFDFFAVFDGHGFYYVAEYLSKTLITTIITTINNLLFNLVDTTSNDGDILEPESIKEIVKYCFDTTNQYLFKHGKAFQYGSTAVLCIHQRKSNGKRFLYCFNCGDSSAFIDSEEYPIQQLSTYHNVSVESEIREVIKRGGTIIDDRVWGVYNITRSFGDFEAIPGITSEPSIQVLELNNNDPNSYKLILTSDGITDVLSKEEIISMIKGEDINKSIHSVIQKALQKQTRDNLSIILAEL